MALTFYTVLLKSGYPVKYIQPENGSEYGRVQTFEVKDHPFSDPAEACGEFEAWIGSAEVTALYKHNRDTKKKLAAWNAMTAK